MFALILAKILPMYFFVLLGYLVGKFSGVKKESIGALLIYCISPFVIFLSVSRLEFSREILIIPFIFFLIALFLGLLFYFIGNLFYRDSRKNILALAAGTGNTGYLGLPLYIALFGDKNIGILLVCTVGILLYEIPFGYYIAALGKNTFREAFFKTLKLPNLWAFTLAFLVSYFSWHVPDFLTVLEPKLTGTYSTLGLMIIGIAIGNMSKFRFDIGFTSLTFIAKFLCWPIIVIALIFMDRRYFQLFDTVIYQIAFIESIVPLAANTVAIATIVDAEPEKVAFAVLLSTIFSLVFIPVMVFLAQTQGFI